MQNAPVMKGSGLTPLDESGKNEEVHVFGKNLEERVVTKDDNEESTPISFNNIRTDQNQSEDDIDSIRKRKFDAITGEEDEDTIFQGDFKLFIWDLTTSNWIEKGRGQLKLNDSVGKDERKSRLIMRVSGTLRIVLNVAINRPFFRILANSKTNLRFTDSQTVWAASGSNAQQLKELIEERLKVEKEQPDLRKKTRSEVQSEENEDISDAPLKRTKAENEDSPEEDSATKASEINETNKDTSSSESKQDTPDLSVEKAQEEQPPEKSVPSTQSEKEVKEDDKESNDDKEESNCESAESER